jgi:response regulator NasT
MRVWLVDSRRTEEPGGLEALLSQLANRPENGLQLLGCRAFWPNFAAEMRVQQPDIIVGHEPTWPEELSLLDVLNCGPAVVLATPPERSLRLMSLAQRHALWFVPAAPGVDCLWLALLGAYAAQQRQAQWKAELVRLQQRLQDRIVIERAKGVMVQRLGITEEEAYRRLRLLSRRQRRQIRDIAQSLLDTQMLLLPEDSSSDESANGDPRRDLDHPGAGP